MPQELVIVVMLFALASAYAGPFHADGGHTSVSRQSGHPRRTRSLQLPEVAKRNVHSIMSEYCIVNSLLLMLPPLSVYSLLHYFYTVYSFYVYVIAAFNALCTYNLIFILIFYILICEDCIKCTTNNYSGTSLLRSPSGLGKSDLNGKVTLLQGVISTVEYNLGLSPGGCNWEVFLLVR